ncbi:MAG: hypothetical protein ABII01_06395 [Candidatus Woesearchaeota archaeon]
MKKPDIKSLPFILNSALLVFIFAVIFFVILEINADSGFNNIFGLAIGGGEAAAPNVGSPPLVPHFTPVRTFGDNNQNEWRQMSDGSYQLFLSGAGPMATIDQYDTELIDHFITNQGSDASFSSPALRPELAQLREPVQPFEISQLNELADGARANFNRVGNAEDLDEAAYAAAGEELLYYETLLGVANGGEGIPQTEIMRAYQDALIREREAGEGTPDANQARRDQAILGQHISDDMRYSIENGMIVEYNTALIQELEAIVAKENDQDAFHLEDGSVITHEAAIEELSRLKAENLVRRAAADSQMNYQERRRLQLEQQRELQRQRELDYEMRIMKEKTFNLLSGILDEYVISPWIEDYCKSEYEASNTPDRNPVDISGVQPNLGGTSALSPGLTAPATPASAENPIVLPDTGLDVCYGSTDSIANAQVIGVPGDFLITYTITNCASDRLDYSVHIRSSGQDSSLRQGSLYPGATVSDEISSTVQNIENVCLNTDDPTIGTDGIFCIPVTITTLPPITTTTTIPATTSTSTTTITTTTLVAS